jgi:hypothetical protein
MRTMLASRSPIAANPRPPSACLKTRLRRFIAAVALLIVAGPAHADPRVGWPAPELAGERWINSAPLSMSGLRGRVVLVEFWTYG